MMKPSRWLSVVGWLGLALLAYVLTRGQGTIADADASTWLAYPLERDHPLEVEVIGETWVRVQVWLAPPIGDPVDPRATTPAQLGWTARAANGEVLAVGHPWFTARSSWSFPERFEDPLHPLATFSTGDRRLSDPRLIEFRTPPGTATIGVSAETIPEGWDAYAVLFQQIPRTPENQIREIQGAEPERNARAAARLGPYPWEEVPLDWRERLVQTLWRRVAALDPGIETVRLVSGRRATPYDGSAAVGLPLNPGAAAAFNLENEVEFHARWTLPDGTTPRPTQTWLEVIGVDGTTVRDLGIVDQIGPLSFESGAHEVRIARDPKDPEAPALLRTMTTGPQRDRAWGDPPRLEGDGFQFVGPDLAGLTYWRTTENAPLSFPIPAGMELRIVARPRLEPGPLPGLSEALPEGERSLTMAVEGVWSETVPVPALPSAYERYTRGDTPNTARVSEESEWFLAPTDHPTVLQISGDAIDVQVFLKEALAPSDVPEAGYPPEVLPPTLRPRYVPYTRRTWRARFPTNPDALNVEGRAIRLDAQVRWVPKTEARQSGLSYRVLELPPPFELVAEPRQGGTRSRVSGTPSRVHIPESGRLSIAHTAPRDQVGNTVTLMVDETAHTETLLSPVGSVQFEGLPPGDHAVTLDTPGVFLAKAPGSKPWTMRRVWRLDAGGARRIRIPARGQGLSIHIAHRSGSDAGTLRWRLEAASGHSPLGQSRRQGHHGLLPSQGHPVVMSRSERPWTWAPPLQLWLQDRIEGGGTLTLTLEDRSDPVWIWVSTTWAPPAKRDGSRHWLIPGGNP